MLKNSARLLFSVSRTIKIQSNLSVRFKSLQQQAFQPVIFPCRLYCTLNNKSKSPAKSSPIISSFISPNEQQQQQQQEHQQEYATEEEERKKQRESSWRTMKYTFVAFGASFGLLGGYLIFELGKPPVDPEGNPMTDEFSNLPTYKQYFYRTLQAVDYFKRMIREPSREKLLPDVLVYPYYQPPYTLVLELTDILVHPDWTYQTGWRFKKRPGIDHFLQSLNGLFEIVIFTAEQGMTVFPIVEALDPNHIISYKLVRDATHFVDGHHVKNLNKLNRDLNRVIVIDWNVDSVKFHPENLLQLQRWMGNDDDNMLMDLAAFLRTIAQSEIEDVREVLRYYSQFDDPLTTFRAKQKQLIEQQEADRQAQDSKVVPVVKRWAPSLLKKPS